jgi:hypothetical protein
MKTIRLVTLSVVGLIAVLGTAALNASDPIAVYARVDRVVLAPDATAPQTIQIFGVFSIASPNDPNGYQAPARGYLFFKLGSDERLARREWADLKEVAGTHQIVAFGNRYTMKARLRAEKDAPDAPDSFATGTGLTKINGNTAYPPIRALVDFRN